jgi:hypothetical protein
MYAESKEGRVKDSLDNLGKRFKFNMRLKSLILI